MRAETRIRRCAMWLPKDLIWLTFFGGGVVGWIVHMFASAFSHKYQVLTHFFP